MSDSKCRPWRLALCGGADCGSKRGAVRLLLRQVVVGIWEGFVLLSGTEPAQVLPGREEILEPSVIAHDAVDDASAGTHDLGRQQNDRM
jgi:hypothetical protein